MDWRKIKEFFEKLFRKQKVLQIDKGLDIKIEKTNHLRKELKIQNNSELLLLQEKYEKGQVLESELSMKKLKELIHLYERQIKELDYKIAIKS